MKRTREENDMNMPCRENDMSRTCEENDMNMPWGENDKNATWSESDEPSVRLSESVKLQFQRRLKQQPLPIRLLSSFVSVQSRKQQRKAKRCRADAEQPRA